MSSAEPGTQPLPSELCALCSAITSLPWFCLVCYGLTKHGACPTHTFTSVPQLCVVTSLPPLSLFPCLSAAYGEAASST